MNSSKRKIQPKPSTSKKPHSGSSVSQPSSSASKSSLTHEIELGTNHKPAQEGSRKRKQAFGQPSNEVTQAHSYGPQNWKRVKVAEDIELGEAGFYMLEELNVEGGLNAAALLNIINRIPIRPANLEEEPVVDTVDSDLEPNEEDPSMDIDRHQDSKRSESKGQNKVESSKIQQKPIKPTMQKSDIKQAKSASSSTKVLHKKEEDQEKFSEPSTAPLSESAASEESGGDISKFMDTNDVEESEDMDIEDSANKSAPKASYKRVIENFVPQESMEEIDMPAWTNCFKTLHKRILLSLKEMKFDKPTKIQEMVLPVALGKRLDIIGSSQTGSGKTLAFGIPIIQQILELHEKTLRLGTPLDSSVKALILSPTRELAIQIVEHLQQLSSNSTPFINVTPVIGGISVSKQMRLLKKSPDIIVATPGRLWELISTGMLEEANSSLSKLRWLVFDEADKMVEFGRFAEMSNILRTIYDSRQRLTSESAEDTNNMNQLHHKQLQTFVFSATMSLSTEARRNLKHIKSAKEKHQRKMKERLQKMKHTRIRQVHEDNADSTKLSGEELFEKLMEQIDFQRQVELVDITDTTHQVSTMEEAKIFCLHEEKDFYLYYFLTKFEGKTIIFVNAISNIKRLLPLFVILRINAFGMHANMEQHHRLKNLEKFKQAQSAVLVSTDVMSRGLDIPQVDHVIHYSIPPTAEVFVHRSGRTARAFATGLNIAIVDPEDKRHYTAIMHALHREEVPDFPVDMHAFSVCKKRVQLAAELDKLSHSEQKTKSEASWLKSKAQDLDTDIPDDLISSEDEATFKKNAYERSKQKLRYKQAKEELRKLLQKQIHVRASSNNYTTIEKGMKQIMKPNSGSFFSPPPERDAAAALAADEERETTKEIPEAKPSAAFQEVVKIKQSQIGNLSSKVIEKEKLKRLQRQEMKQTKKYGITGPLKSRR